MVSEHWPKLQRKAFFLLNGVKWCWGYKINGAMKKKKIYYETIKWCYRALNGVGAKSEKLNGAMGISPKINVKLLLAFSCKKS